ncbi:S8 family serine peptidase [Actinoplanes sp. URMC 104]|uniref:S8 family serine peptidase n=1 Tax=Actinoplanes sp. URMC 104 TaxID=3423409 RepID=UPI003F1A6CC8
MKTLKVTASQDISTGSGITVAVVDSGTYPHPDLLRNLAKGSSFVTGENGNGQNDRFGHGTEMAALIAAHGRGTRGVLGIAPSSKILPLKISNSKAAPASEMAEAIQYATERNAAVINVSAAIGPSFEVQDAVSSALDSDAVVVASVGNTASSAVVGYPAAIDGVLAVGAVGRDGNYTRSSLRTSKVAICAPGVDITTAEPRQKYVDIGGTSPATAIVSGAVALVRAKFPELSAKNIIHRLTATADDIGPPGRDDECGFGRLNIVKALTANVPPLEGQESEAPSPSATGTATAVGPQFATPTSGAAKSDERAGGGSVLLFGGLAGVLAAGGVLAVMVLRRRRRG